MPKVVIFNTYDIRYVTLYVTVYYFWATMNVEVGLHFSYFLMLLLGTSLCVTQLYTVSYFY